MPSLYTFAEYSPKWPQQFQSEAERLQELMGDELVEIHHIGSTSVPSLAAKPVIDLLPVVRKIESIDNCTEQLEAAGYRAWGEYGLPGRRLFTKDQAEYRTHNIHIYQYDHSDVQRHLAFCAYLRQHADARREYEGLKRQAYADHPADIAAYSDAKNSWIKQHEPIAIRWYRERHR